MSDAVDTSNTDGNNTSGTTSTAGDEPKTITMTSQQLADRLARAKPTDYDDLRAKAARLDEIEQANKSEIEKAAEKAASAERERDQAKAEALRLRIAAKHSISDEDADLFLTGTDEATLTKQAERLAARTTAQKKQGNHVPREGGATPPPAETELRSFTRGLFNPAQA